MTRQHLDVLHNNGQDYVVLEVESSDNAQYRADIYTPPLDNLAAMSTACSKGYYAYYEVSTENGNLLLKALEVRTEDGVYPKIGGIDPVTLCDTSRSARYVGLNMHMTHLTGRIMLGCDWMEETRWDHSGATNYKTVLEIHVQQGKVVKALDVSNDVASMRQKNEQRDQVLEDYHHYAWCYEKFLEQQEQQRLVRLAGGGTCYYSGDEDDL